MYTVEQTFETLGDPCRRTFAEFSDAREYSRQLCESLMTMIQSWPVDNTEPAYCATGYSIEIRTWQIAARLSENSATYTPEAARAVAGMAVDIIPE